MPAAHPGALLEVAFSLTLHLGEQSWLNDEERAGSVGVSPRWTGAVPCLFQPGDNREQRVPSLTCLVPHCHGTRERKSLTRLRALLPLPALRERETEREQTCTHVPFLFPASLAALWTQGWVCVRCFQWSDSSCWLSAAGEERGRESSSVLEVADRSGPGPDWSHGGH